MSGRTMQVSRTLKCLQRHQRLRNLQIHRNVDDAMNSSSHQKGAQPCAIFLSYLGRQFSSTPPENESQAISSKSATSESDFSKQKSLSDSHNHQFTPKSGRDGLDNRQSRNKMVPINPPTTLNILTAWHSQLEKAKLDKRTMETWNKIQPQLNKTVDLALKDNAPADMRLKCLKILVFPEEDNFLAKKLLNQTAKDAQYLTIKTIADIVHLLSVSSPTDLRRQVRKDLVLLTVNKRWFEIGPRQIVLFLYQLDNLFDMKDVCLRNRQCDLTASTSTTGPSAGPADATDTVSNTNLENRLINIVDELKPKDLARVIIIMGKWRNRNLVLLQAVHHRLSLADMSNFSLLQLSNVLFACSILSIHNPALLEKTIEKLSTREITSPGLISSMLSSLSHLRWYNPNLVCRCLNSMSSIVNDMNFHDSYTTLMSLANLYILPQSEQDISVIKALGQRAFAEAKSSSDKVDVAWCLSILKLLDRSMAGMVLEPGFAQKFCDATNFQHRGTLQKLWDINLSAKYELNGYDGPWVEEEGNLKSDDGYKKSTAHGILVSSLTNALGKFVNMDSYVKVSQRLPNGLYADAVMCSDLNGNPKPLAEIEIEKDSAAINLRRMAFQVIPFNGVLTSHPTLCGVHQMKARHLRHVGYTPVQIPYFNLRKSQSVLEHINAIQSHMKQAVCGSDNTKSETDAALTSPSSSSTT